MGTNTNTEMMKSAVSRVASAAIASRRSSAMFCTAEAHSVESIIETIPSEKDRADIKRINYGMNQGKVVAPAPVPTAARAIADAHGFDIEMYKFEAGQERRAARRTKFGVTQTSVKAPTDAPVGDQVDALLQYHETLVEAAAAAGTNIICFQEAFTMPFAFCTREKLPWTDFAECAETGHTVQWCQELALKHNMVIVAPILERDDLHAETLWNTAVVIGNNGNIIGKDRKVHIPRVGDFNESTYYMEGDFPMGGWPTFDTQFGKIGINICYGRHHPLNWMAHGLNGAEIVFNPSATVGALSEPMWPVEARCAAIANSYFVAGNNRIGTESFPSEFTSGDKKPAHKDFGHFYGSSYVAAPDASRCPGLSRTNDGVVIADADLNLCRQIRDAWGIQMTGRHRDYADFLEWYGDPKFRPNIVHDPSRKPQ